LAQRPVEGPAPLTLEPLTLEPLTLEPLTLEPLTRPSPQRREGGMETGAGDGDLGARAGQPGERAEPHPLGGQAPGGQHERRGGALAMPLAADDEDGVG